jgi:citrate synthase
MNSMITQNGQTQEIKKGLEGVVAHATQISSVDGQKGRLIYRGYRAEELAINKTFEEVAHLLWFGNLPSPCQLTVFKEKMAANRGISSHIKQVIDALPAEADMMSVLRTALSANCVLRESWPPSIEQAMILTAQVPTIIAYRHRKLNGLPPVDPRSDLSHTANYLYMLHGQEPSDAQVAALDAYLILCAEHGMNASTFSARVTTSTRADMVSAVVTAIGTMKGPLHGGAPSEVDDTLAAIGSKENAEPYIRKLLERGERLMGFGHRIYKTKDPRAQALSSIAKAISNEDPWLDLAYYVEKVAERLLAEYKPGRNLYANIEFYAGAVLRSVGIPKHLYTPTFTLARMAGWTAHILEQVEEDRLIRPQSVYIGPVYDNMFVAQAQ